MAYKKTGNIDWRKPTIINNFHEGTTDHIKEFAGYFEIDGKECVVTHKCKFRVEAIREFNQIAKEYQGKFKYMYPTQG